MKRRAPVQGLSPGTVVPGIAGMGFGGGFWRCPGRFFAEAELALLLQLVLHTLVLTPVGQGGQQQQQAQQQQAQQELRLAPPRTGWLGWLRDVVVFGAGWCGGAAAQARVWNAEASPPPRLPRADLRRLVGFKVPAEGWRVRVRVRMS
jgi:hypothetical protein